MRKMKKLFAFSVAAFLFASALAQAATTGALFSGSILSTCILVAGTPGIITANGDYTEMSSHNGGGLASTVVATATGSSFDITTEAPPAFTLAPAGANTGTTFSSTYALSGATTAAEADGATPRGLNIGISTVTVNMAATKSADAFPASLTYTATVTVRCE
jgi:hypothetical protein